MSKQIKSPVKKWPGTVTLHDPLSLPQVVAVQDALESAKALAEDGDLEKLGLAEFHNALLPAIEDCIEIWEMEGLDDPPNPFPGTPRKSAAELMNWLSTEVVALFNEAEAVPNE